MPDKATYPKSLTALIILGAIGFLLLISAAFAVPSMMRYWFSAVQKPVIDMEHVGELDAVCGGRERYPCKPGLVCSVPPESWERTYGNCITDTNSPPPKDVGESCAGDYQCLPDLRCIRGPDSPLGSCEPSTPDSPSF